MRLICSNKEQAPQETLPSNSMRAQNQGAEFIKNLHLKTLAEIPLKISLPPLFRSKIQIITSEINTIDIQLNQV
jgi:hypothetical protein